MKVNPFCIDFFSNFVKLGENKQFLYLHFHPIDEVGKMRAIAKKVPIHKSNGLDACECIETRYRKHLMHRTHVISLLVDGNGKDAVHVDELLVDIDTEFPSQGNDLKQLYYSLFEGMDHFSIHMEANTLRIHDVDSDECLLHLSFYELNMQNLKHVKDFFPVVHDLSDKMGMMIDIYVFVHKLPNHVKSKGYLVYKERNSYDFKNTNRKIKNIAEFDFILKEVKLDRRIVSSFLLRRWIDENSMDKFGSLENILECFKFERPHVHGTVPGIPEKPPVEQTPVPSQDLLPVESEFASRVQARVPGGTFHHGCTYVVQDGAYILVHDAHEACARKFFETDPTCSKLMLVFPDKQGAEAFGLAFPGRLHGIVECKLLADL